ncbi:Crp/Fnr family transcriptional regulator [Actinoplanes sp. NPDC051411]|uniref:Crp/Fnr family transcriptional regulator n=1 Tax=Actinoplanes sp. NPDC051411 TaxID=3155522 RepID=UPI0034158319
MTSLESIPALRTLAPTASQRLADRTRPIHFASGAVLRPADSIARDVVFLLSGKLAATHSSFAGARMWPEQWIAPAIADKAAVLIGTPSPSALIAVTDVFVRLLPVADFLRLLEGERAVREHVLTQLARDAMSARLRLARAGMLPALARIATWLDEQHPDRPAARHGSQEQHSERPVARHGSQEQHSERPVAWHESQELVGLMLGMSRVTVNRALARLADAGAITKTPHGIVVADRSLLRKFMTS